MGTWLVNFHALIEYKNIPPECVYNANQTGLYYQNLRDNLYVDMEQKKLYHGFKKMKDKTHITVMLFTSASGMKCPL